MIISRKKEKKEKWGGVSLRSRVKSNEVSKLTPDNRAQLESQLALLKAYVNQEGRSLSTMSRFGGAANHPYLAQDIKERIEEANSRIAAITKQLQEG